MIFTYYDLLRHNLPSRGDDVAIVDGDRELTYGELATQADRVASLLLEAGDPPR